MKLSFWGAPTTVTLVIENTAVKLLTTQGSAVKGWAKAPLEPGWLVDGVIQESRAVGEAVGRLFRQQGVSKQRVVTCVSGGHSIYRSFALPAMRREDLRPAVVYQAKREFPVAIEDLYLTWELTGFRDQHNHVFVAGVPRDSVSALIETLKHAAVEPRAIDIKPLALARACGRATAIIANMEADSVDMVYLSDFAPALVRTVYFPEQATSVQTLAERLSEELHQGIRFYNDSNPQQPVGPNTPLFVATGAADYFSLAEALYGSLEYTLERLAPPLEHPDEFPLEEYATNVGLALRGK